MKIQNLLWAFAGFVIAVLLCTNVTGAWSLVTLIVGWLIPSPKTIVRTLVGTAVMVAYKTWLERHDLIGSMWHHAACYATQKGHPTVSPRNCPDCPLLH